MMVLFEVHLTPGADPETLVSPETKRETGAQVMTPIEAQLVGLEGLPDFEGQNVRLIAVAKRDAPWIQRGLEANDACGGFKIHEMG